MLQAPSAKKTLEKMKKREKEKEKSIKTDEIELELASWGIVYTT